MDKPLIFKDRESFRRWLELNVQTGCGVWLLFGKKGGPQTLTAEQALEEALCFGWIDGQMRSLDDKSYKKYFSPRRAGSKWSEKNKALAASLKERGIMTGFGEAKITQSKEDGGWDAPKLAAVTEEQINALGELLKEFEPAYSNFCAMPPSVKKTYTRAYLDAKTEEGRLKRLSRIAERLKKNLKPM